MAEEVPVAPPIDLAADGEHDEKVETASENTTSSAQDSTNGDEAEQPEANDQDSVLNSKTEEQTKASPADGCSTPESFSTTTLTNSSNEVADRSHGDSGSDENDGKSLKIETLTAESLPSSGDRDSDENNILSYTDGSTLSVKCDGLNQANNQSLDDDNNKENADLPVEEFQAWNDRIPEANTKVDEEETPKADSPNRATYHKTDNDDVKEKLDDKSEAFDDGVPVAARGLKVCLFAVTIGVIVFAILVKQFQTESPTQQTSPTQVEIFLKQMESVKAQFTHQRFELWNRSQIHLVRHLQSTQPTEPVSVILTAGLKAQKTLRCLAQGLANAFSSAYNASVLFIDGYSKANQNSDRVKLEIDSQLQRAFEGNTPAAIIHRFEELPPGSTLIFYRYCDHENAAYKKPFLIFTVLLGDQNEIPADARFSAVEEMVDDHLQKRFLSHSRPVSFDSMDRDKYGGLWSRISHLILPVAAEERIERKGCGRT